MLILERKLGEKVVIEHNEGRLEVTLQKDDKGRYKLCFDVPSHYKIFRKKLTETCKNVSPFKDNIHG